MLLSTILCVAAAVADTPAMAIILATRAESPAPALGELGRGSFARLPRPGPGVDYEADVLPERRRDQVRLRVSARVRGRVVADQVVSLPRTTDARVVRIARPVRRGERITAADVELRSYRGQRRDLFFTSLDEVVGQVAKVNLHPGAGLRRASVRAPFLVQRGRRVRVEIVRGALRVGLAGEALASGARGDLIRVRNPRSGRIVSAVVIGHGRAEVVQP